MAGPQNKGEQAAPRAGAKGDRDAKGRLLPGNTANPGGRPPLMAKVRERAGKSAMRMLEILEGIAEDIEAKDRDRTTAAMGVLAYAVGRPPQAIEITGPAGGPIQTVDLTALSAEELLQLRDIAEKARAGDGEGGATTEGDPGDPTPTE